MHIPELSTAVEAISATSIILVTIVFLKYITSRDKKDIKMQEQHAEVITAIVGKHDDRTKEFQDTVRQMDSTVRRLHEK